MRAPSKLKAAVLTVAQMYQADRLAIEGGTSGWQLMRSAGQAVAQQALSLCERGRRVLVLCGPGNNGGDGIVAAALLRQEGRRVTLYTLGKPAELAGDAALAYHFWRRSGGAAPRSLQEILREVPQRGDLIVDALFGAGLSRPVDGEAAEVIAYLTKHGVRSLAVDVPSGVDGDTGMVRGCCLPAEATVCFFRPKPAHYLYPGKAHCGRLVVADIGIPDTVLTSITPEVCVNGPALWSIPAPGWTDHKYSRGFGTILGSATMSGAARLAVRGARRIGLGLASVAVPESATLIYGLDAPGALIVALPEEGPRRAARLAALYADPRRVLWLLGPGLAADGQTRREVLDCLEAMVGKAPDPSRQAILLDAGALSAFADNPRDLFAALQAVRAAGGEAVLTPHDGEFLRLFPDLSPDQDLSRMDRAMRAAVQSGAVVVLKGADAVVAAPNGAVALTPWTAADLATGGSGDVLAGMILGLIGQGMDAFAAACAGVWVHSEAARRIGAGLIAEDLPERIPSILADLRS